MLFRSSFNVNISITMATASRRGHVTQQSTNAIKKSNYLTHLTVNSRLGNIKLSNHAKRDGSTAGLGIVHLPLEHDGLNVLVLREDLGSAGSRGSSSNNGDLVLHVEGGRRSDTVGDGGGGGEGRGGEGRRRGGKAGEGHKGELHFGYCWGVDGLGYAAPEIINYELEAK